MLQMANLGFGVGHRKSVSFIGDSYYESHWNSQIWKWEYLNIIYTGICLHTKSGGGGELNFRETKSYISGVALCWNILPQETRAGRDMGSG